MEVTREQARKITAEINDAVKTILEKNGMVADRTSSNYGDHYAFKITAHFQNVNESGIDENGPYAVAFRQLGHSYGLRSEALGATVTLRGASHTFLGVAPTRRKFPYAFKNVATGKTMLYPADCLRHFPVEMRSDSYDFAVRGL